MWSLRNRSSDSRVRVGLRKRRPKARFNSTYRVKTGASMEENAAVALVIAAPPLPRVLFLGPEGGLRVSPRLPVADTLMCLSGNDDRGCPRWSCTGFRSLEDESPANDAGNADLGWECRDRFSE